MTSSSRAQFTIERLREIVNAAEVGDKLIAEKELATQLGVSRVTLREALSRLWHEGEIVRKWGSGTFIAEGSSARAAALYNNFFIDSSSVGSLPARISAAGRTVALHDFEVSEGPIPQWVSEEPGFDVPLWRVARCLHIDGTPAVLIYDYLPQHIAGVEIKPHELEHPDRDLQTFLRLLGQRVVKQEALLIAKAADRDAARALGLETGMPLIAAEQRSVAEDGTVVACSDLIYRSDGLGQILVRTTPE